MKSHILCLIMFALAVKSFSQVGPQLSLKQYYLKRSKNQKVAASTLLGSGLALIGTGVVVNFPARSGSFDDIAAKGGMIVIGTVATITSIPFFIASRKNKKRALKATAFLKIEPTPATIGFPHLTNLYLWLVLSFRSRIKSI